VYAGRRRGDRRPDLCARRAACFIRTRPGSRRRGSAGVRPGCERRRSATRQEWPPGQCPPRPVRHSRIRRIQPPMAIASPTSAARPGVLVRTSGGGRHVVGVLTDQVPARSGGRRTGGRPAGPLEGRRDAAVSDLAVARRSRSARWDAGECRDPVEDSDQMRRFCRGPAGRRGRIRPAHELVPSSRSPSRLPIDDRPTRLGRLPSFWRGVRYAGFGPSDPTGAVEKDR
jgi:hypothetical protein